jgi:hypothetical protein
VEDLWGVLKGCVYPAAEEVLGPAVRKRHDWFDENDGDIAALLKAKREAFGAVMSASSDAAHKRAKAKLQRIKADVQRGLRRMQDRWWAAKAAALQACADEHDSRGMFELMRGVFGPRTSAIPTVRAAGGELLKEKADVDRRWVEHYTQVFNCFSVCEEDVLEMMEQRPEITSLGVPFVEAEVGAALQQLKNHKAAGVDGIPADVLKHGGLALRALLTKLFNLCLETGAVPQDWKDAVVCSLFKNKGDKEVCGNYRPISLLSTAGKAFSRVLINRLMDDEAFDTLVPESQCGFRRERATVDMLFCARQLQEKCFEQQRPLFSCFIDLTKAFDTTNRVGLWVVLGKFGFPSRVVDVLRAFHDGMSARLVRDGALSDSFGITNGVKQGCVMAPQLFSLYLAAALLLAFSDMPELDGDVHIRFRKEGKLYNTRALGQKSGVDRALLRDLLFADDMGLFSHTEGGLQRVVDLVANAVKKFGLTISIVKTEVMVQPVRGTVLPQPSIRIGGSVLKCVPQFTYLGGVLDSETPAIDKEITARLAKASRAFGALHARVWSQRGVTAATKVAVYRAVVLPSLLYGAETWVTKTKHFQLLERFHISSLRRILGVVWHDRVSNVDILARAKVDRVEVTVRATRLRWLGHVWRMPDSRLPRQVLFGEILGKRPQGGQRQRWKDCVKADLIQFGIPTEGWSDIAADRDKWRVAIHAGRARLGGAMDAAAAARKRQRCASNAARPAVSAQRRVAQAARVAAARALAESRKKKKKN